jgi:hypothetical protein
MEELGAWVWQCGGLRRLKLSGVSEWSTTEERGVGLVRPLPRACELDCCARQLGAEQSFLHWAILGIDR